MLRSLMRYSFAPLAAGLLLGGCDSTEPTPGHDHTPEGARLVVSGVEIDEGGNLIAVEGQTLRIEVEFLNAEGEEITGIEDTHHTALVFSPAGLATVVAVDGQNFSKDVTFQQGAGEGTLNVGYGHEEAADELSFGPFTVQVEATTGTVRVD